MLSLSFQVLLLCVLLPLIAVWIERLDSNQDLTLKSMRGLDNR